jgi:hypothetical protein
LRVFQEVDDLLKLFLGLFNPSHILESGLLLLRRQQTGARFSEAERLVSARLHLAHHEDPKSNQEQDRGRVDEK